MACGHISFGRGRGPLQLVALPHISDTPSGAKSAPNFRLQVEWTQRIHKAHIPHGGDALRERTPLYPPTCPYV